MKSDEFNLEKLAELMNVLGVENRLRIVSLLGNYESLCVNALACHLEISQSAVSQHLRILHFSGFVSSHREGYYTHYKLNREVLDKSIELLARLTVKTESVSAAKCSSKEGSPCANAKAAARNRKI